MDQIIEHAQYSEDPKFALQDSDLSTAALNFVRDTFALGPDTYGVVRELHASVVYPRKDSYQSGRVSDELDESYYRKSDRYYVLHAAVAVSPYSLSDEGKALFKLIAENEMRISREDIEKERDQVLADAAALQDRAAALQERAAQMDAKLAQRDSNDAAEK